MTNLVSDLAARPTKGLGWTASRAAIMNASGELESLCQARAVDHIHPDRLVIGGCLELKKTADMAAKYSVGMMVHSNATPIGYAAGAHADSRLPKFPCHGMAPAAASLAQRDNRRRGPRG